MSRKLHFLRGIPFDWNQGLRGLGATDSAGNCVNITPQLTYQSETDPVGFLEYLGITPDSNPDDFVYSPDDGSYSISETGTAAITAILQAPPCTEGVILAPPPAPYAPSGNENPPNVAGNYVWSDGSDGHMWPETGPFYGTGWGINDPFGQQWLVSQGLPASTTWPELTPTEQNNYVELVQSTAPNTGTDVMGAVSDLVTHFILPAAGMYGAVEGAGMLTQALSNAAPTVAAQTTSEIGSQAAQAINDVNDLSVAAPAPGVTITPFDASGDVLPSQITPLSPLDALPSLPNPPAPSPPSPPPPPPSTPSIPPPVPQTGPLSPGSAAASVIQRVAMTAATTAAAALARSATAPRATSLPSATTPFVPGLPLQTAPGSSSVGSSNTWLWVALAAAALFLS